MVNPQAVCVYVGGGQVAGESPPIPREGGASWLDSHPSFRLSQLCDLGQRG